MIENRDIKGLLELLESVMDLAKNLKSSSLERGLYLADKQQLYEELSCILEYLDGVRAVDELDVHKKFRVIVGKPFLIQASSPEEAQNIAGISQRELKDRVS